MNYSDSQYEEMKAHFAILAQAHRYSDAANRKDSKLFRSLWAEDSNWTIGPPINRSFNGVDEIVDAFVHLLDSWEFFVQLTSSYSIQINGNKARAHFYVNEIARSRTGESNYNLSQYEDNLVYQNGQWLFTERNYRVIYLDSSPLKGISFKISS